MTEVVDLYSEDLPSHELLHKSSQDGNLDT